MKFTRLVLLGLTLAFCSVAGLRAADAVYAPFRPDMTAGTAYTIDARALHPTQFSTGRREIEFKRARFDRMPDAELVGYLKQKDVPVVIGPGGTPYLTDGHHTISALLECRHADKTVYGHILENWSKLPTAVFWKKMRMNGYTYLRDAAGRERPPAELPRSLRDMKPDPYRGLAWALMDAGEFKEIKPPAVYFQEFYWADFFRDKVRWDDASEADFQRAVKQAAALAHSPAAADLPGYVPAK